MGMAEHQDLEDTVEELQVRLLQAEANIATLVRAIDRLNQSVDNLRFSRSKSFDSLFIEKQLDGIMNRRQTR